LLSFSLKGFSQGVKFIEGRRFHVEDAEYRGYIRGF
jgi:hypothetical protein